jgi:hypothetical protein
MTSTQFHTLEDLYQYYNQKLFEGKLSECLVNLSRHGGAHGFFVAKEWVSTPRVPIDGDSELPKPLTPQEKPTTPVKLKVIHEISLTPDSLNRPDKFWHATLVHEMVHLWQHDFGKHSRSCYHNKQWANKMELLGLMPSDTGLPNGNKTGQHMTHYIMAGGLFEKAFQSIAQADLERLTLPYRLNRSKYMNTTDEDMIKFMLSFGSEPTAVKSFRYPSSDPDQPKSRSGVRVRYVCECDNRLWGKPDLVIKCMSCGELFEER